MIKLYVYKITNKVINKITDKEWCLEDVPILWREKVKQAMIEQEEVTNE